MLKDLDRYLGSVRCSLTARARRILETLEQIAERYDREPYHDTFLLAVLSESPAICASVNRLGGNVVRAMETVQEAVSESDASYEDSDWYTATRDRELSPKLGVIDLAVAIAKRRGKRHIGELDLFEALLRVTDESGNPAWVDQRLRTPYNTLAHILGSYVRELDIPFPALLTDLGFAAMPERSVAEAAPRRARASVTRLLEDHPDYDRNCFLMMSFRPSRHLIRIYSAIRSVMTALGFTTLRADQRRYSDDILTNIETYVYGCSFGIAVHERVETEAHNANVALEVGYFLGLQKPVCLLKERTLPRLPSDLAGKLYVDFDLNRLHLSLRGSLAQWLGDYGFLPSG